MYNTLYYTTVLLNWCTGRKVGVYSIYVVQYIYTYVAREVHTFRTAYGTRKVSRSHLPYTEGDTFREW